MADERRMERRQKALADFGEFALRSDDLDAVLTEACRLVADALGTGRAKVLEVEHARRTLFVRAGVGWEAGIVGRLRLPMAEHSSEAYSIELGAPVITNDLAGEGRFDLPAFLKAAGVKALANVPIFLPGGKAFGLLQVDASEPRAFDDDDSQFLRTYATILGPVIDRLLKAQTWSATETRFRAIVEAARDYAVILTDAEDRITDWFPGAEAVFGWTAEEAIGQSGALLFTPEDRQAGEPDTEVRIARQHGSAPDVRWHMRKDGRRVFIEGTVAALRSASGEVRGFQKIGQDVTERRRAEEALRESEARHSLLIGSWAQAVWETDANGVVVTDSPSWRAYTGQTLDEWLGYGWLDAIHPDDRAHAERQWREATAARNAVNTEYRLIAPDGGWRWTNVRAAPVLDAGGRIEKWAGMNIDIDARRRTEEALRESERALAADLSNAERLRALSDRLVSEESFEAIYDEVLSTAVAIAGADAGTIQNYDLGTKTLKLIATLNFSRTVIDHFQRVDTGSRTACGIALKTGERAFVDFPDEIADAGCQLLVGEGIQSAIALPLVSRTGVPLGMLNAHWRTPRHRPSDRALRFLNLLARQAADLIEQRRAQTALRESEKRFRAFAENSADVIWIASGDGTRLEYLSPAFERMYGADPAGVTADLGRWAELVHPEDRQQAMRAMPRALAGETAIAHYRVVRPVDGRVVHLRDTGFPIRDEGGTVRSIAGIVQDVTDVHDATVALEGEKERFRILAEGIPSLVWRSSDEGRWTWASPQWRTYTGQGEEGSQGLGWLGAVHPEDRARAMASWNEARHHGRLDVEYRVRRATDGAWRWHQTRSVPVRQGPTQEQPEDRIVEWLGTTTDIEELKRYQADQAVLLAELQHRTRNLLAIVSIIASKSLPRSPERAAYDDRLANLGRVQGFLSRSTSWEVALQDLVHAELHAVGEGVSDRVTVEGPPVELSGDKVQTLALALHELATNAAKYGAITQDNARLRVSWQVLPDGAGEHSLVLEWIETGVTMPPGAPTRRGYGSELIERALPYQLRAETRREFASDGVRCTIVLPPGTFKIRADRR